MSRNSICTAIDALVIGTGLVLLPQVANAALIHAYEFSGATVTDDVGAINGSLIGGATVSGGFLNLNGSSYVELSGAAVPTNPNFSVAISAAFSSTFPTGLYGELIAQGGSPNFYIGYDPSGLFRLSDYFLPGYTLPAIPVPNDNLFHDYLLAVTAAETKFYIDGALAFSALTSMSFSLPQNTLFGRQCCGYEEFITGFIDYVRIYDAAIVPADVLPPSPVPEPSTLALFGVGLLGFAALRRRQTKRAA